MRNTDAIREVAKDCLHQTNKFIASEVFRRFSLSVTSSEIINTIGSHEQRIQTWMRLLELQEKATEYLKDVGDYQLARMLLLLAESRTNTNSWE